jgi:hypothetical protein
LWLYHTKGSGDVMILSAQNRNVPLALMTFVGLAAFISKPTILVKRQRRLTGYTNDWRLDPFAFQSTVYIQRSISSVYTVLIRARHYLFEPLVRRASIALKLVARMLCLFVQCVKFQQKGKIFDCPSGKLALKSACPTAIRGCPGQADSPQCRALIDRETLIDATGDLNTELHT